MTKIYTLSNGKQVKVTVNNQRVSKKYSGEHFAYSIVLGVVGDNKVYRTTFHDTPLHYRNGVGPTEEMIDGAISAIIQDFDTYDKYQLLESFLEGEGYDPYEEYEIGEKAYNACMATYKGIIKLLNRREVEELKSILS